MVNSHRRKLAPKCRFNFSLCFLFRFTDLILCSEQYKDGLTIPDQSGTFLFLLIFRSIFPSRLLIRRSPEFGGGRARGCCAASRVLKPSFLIRLQKVSCSENCSSFRICLGGVVGLNKWGMKKSLSLVLTFPSSRISLLKLIVWANFFFGKSDFILFWVCWCLH